MNKPRRTRLLAAVHAAKRDLGLDEETYRAMLTNETGKHSAADMSIKELNQVIDRMRKSGAKKSPRKRVGEFPGRPHNLESNAMLGKIEALLAELKAPWSYADAIARNQTGIGKVAWVRKKEQLQAIITALSVELEKRNLLTRVEELIQGMHCTTEYIEENFKLKSGWKRHRPTLKKLIQHLLDKQLEG